MTEHEYRTMIALTQCLVSACSVIMDDKQDSSFTETTGKIIDVSMATIIKARKILDFYKTTEDGINELSKTNNTI